jgi:hypothetical protein
MTSPYAIQVRKEIRALLPWCAGVAFTTTAISMLARQQAGFPNYRHDEEIWVVMAHALGILAVAAVSMGHELTHNTLSSLLVQPISRLRVLATKLGVLIPAVMLLGLVGNWLFLDRYVPATTASRSLFVWGPVMAGIGLVPLLTVLTRRPLGGVVFSIAIPGLILAVSERFYSMRDGTQALTITWYGTLVASALGVVVLWRRFQRMESAGDGGLVASGGWPTRDAASTSPDAAGTRAVPRRWTWLFVMKELRLQQMTFAVSGLYALACVGVTMLQRNDPLYVGPTFETLTGLHDVFVALLAGSLASAEERHLGTLAPQLLLPQAAWRQFGLKVVVTAGLASALAIGVPLLLSLILRPADPFFIEYEFIAGILTVVCAAIYVSSLCANSLWALLASFPALAFAGGFGLATMQTVHLTYWRWWPPDERRFLAVLEAAHAAGRWPAVLKQMDWISWFQRQETVVVGALVCIVALYFAARNHRSLDRNARIVIRQVLTMALLAVGTTAAYFAACRYAYTFVR